MVLQGVPYPQPYVIEAVGDVGELTSAIADDHYLQIYREQSDDPAIAVGWDLDIEDEITAPAYDGLLDLSYATPIAPSGQAADSRPSGASRAPSARSGSRSAGRSGVVGRRRGRRLVGRDEQRDHRRPAAAAAAGRDLVGDRAARLGGPVVAADVVLEAGVDDLLDRVGPVQPDHVGHLLGPLLIVTVTVLPCGTDSPPGGLGLEDLALGLVGLHALELGSQLGVAQPVAGLVLGGRRRGTAPRPSACPDETTMSTEVPGVDVLVAVGVLVDDLVLRRGLAGLEVDVADGEPGVADRVAGLVLGHADQVRAPAPARARTRTGRCAARPRPRRSAR